MLNKKIGTHPETKNYGLDCDYNLWVEFNKEILIRNWIKSSRNYVVVQNSFEPPKEYEVDYGTEIERKLANAALDELVDGGYINKCNYLKTPKAYL